MTRLSITHEQCVKGRVKDHAWRLNRACKCGAAIPYEAHANRRSCDYCSRTATARNRQTALAAGCCRWCLKRPRTKDVFCDVCRDKAHTSMREANAKRKAILRATGWCTQCGKAPVEGTHTRCKPCLVKYAPKKQPARPKRLFVCACGRQELGTAVRNKKRCKKCSVTWTRERRIERLRDREEAAVEAGNCATCLKRPSHGARECFICQQRRKLRAMERAERAKS